MKTYLGKNGLNASWQKPFPETMKCHKCGGNCRIMFVAYENEEEFKHKEKYVCDLHENEEGKYWVHDAIACGIYLCEKCFEPNTILNQA